MEPCQVNAFYENVLHLMDMANVNEAEASASCEEALCWDQNVGANTNRNAKFVAGPCSERDLSCVCVDGKLQLHYSEDIDISSWRRCV